jgi:chromosome segregation ATPase
VEALTPDWGDVHQQIRNVGTHADRAGEYTQEELEKLQYQLKEAENEKVVEEKKLKAQIQQQEQQIKALQNELNILNLQIKEKDQEYRLNELKIRELRRQLPAKVLKPLEAAPKTNTAKNR